MEKNITLFQKEKIEIAESRENEPDSKDKCRHVKDENGVNQYTLEPDLLEDDDEDLAKFSKFAGTYLQANKSDTFNRKVLQEPIVPMENDDDKTDSEDKRRQCNSENGIGEYTLEPDLLEGDDEDLAKFSKFASTYLQANKSYTLNPEALQEPFVPMENFDDTKDNLALYGDLIDKLLATPQPEAAPDHDTYVPFTLKEYSFDHFRSPAENLPSHRLTLFKLLCPTCQRKPVDLWRHSKEPLKQPLLKTLLGEEELCQTACACFLVIAKYMGDQPTKLGREVTELTYQIYEPPLANELLRDEIYCQIIKQLTYNKNKTSEKRGWELMWLATGCFFPSTNLLTELMKFLRSSKNHIAKDCVNRIQKTFRYIDIRTNKHLFISNAVEVESSTRGKDFCQNLSTRLGLKSSEGFSLYVKIQDKVVSVPGEDFFFDFIRHLTDGIRKKRQGEDGTVPKFIYRVFFMEKLWSNTVPGEDVQADRIFHYYQELPKFLRGYHNCTRDEAAQIAVLIYRVKIGNNQCNFQYIPRMLKELVPLDLEGTQSPDDWKREIMNNYTQDEQSGLDDPKVELLKIIYKSPTFGSAFFEVEAPDIQKLEPAYPSVLLIAINKDGVNVINRETKDILATHPFTMIPNWSAGNTYLHMTIDSQVRCSKLLLVTSLAYQMDDLLTSYISSMPGNANTKIKGK